MAVLREDEVRITYSVDSSPLDEIDSAVDDIVGDADRAMRETSNATSEAARSTADAVRDSASRVAGATKTSMSAAEQAGREALESIKNAGHGLVDAFGKIRQGPAAIADAVKGKAVAAFKNLGDKIKALPFVALGKIAQGVTKIKDGLKKLPLTMLNKLKDGLKAAGTAAMDTAKKIGSIAVKGIAAGAAAVAGLGVAAVKMGSEFESAFAQVKTIMDPAEMGFDEMSEGIKKLSNDTGIASTDLAGTVYNVISATGDTEHALDLAGQASKLAVAGFTDTDSALSVLTTSMNAYGLTADQAAHISDSLIMVQNKGVTTVADLAGSMGKAIASASAYGVDLENLEAAYISITKAGINTAEGTTYISSMMKELGDSGSAAAKALKKQTGKSFDQLMKDGGGLNDALQALSDSVKGDSTALMNLWSSAEAGKASAAIVGQGLDNFKGNLEELKTAAGLTETAFDTMQNTFENKLGKMKTIGVNLLTSIYSGMQGKLGGFADFGIEALQKLSDGFSTGGFTGLATALQGVMKDAFGMAITQVSGLITTYGPTIMSYGAQMVTNVANGLTQSLPTLIPKGVSMVLNFAQGAIAALPNVLSLGTQVIHSAIQGVLNSLPVLAAQGPVMIHDLVTSVIGALPELGQALLEGIIGILQNLPSLLAGALKGLGTGIMDGVKGWFSKDKGTEEAGATAIESVASGVTTNTFQVETAMADSSTAAATSFSTTMTTVGAPMMVTAAEEATTQLQQPFDNLDLSSSGEMAGQGFAQGLHNSRGMIM
ncbi:MAG: phage tail tape measure protein, partial [Clostridia bacterium]|nr:phage tail tape measure protein [Clostridia bacterium]